MKSLLRIILLATVTISTSLSLAIAIPVRAQSAILQGGGTAQGIGSQNQNKARTLADCTADGNCSIEHILLLANSIIRWAVAICGSVALLMYVVGGVWMIFSQGNSGRIERGRDIIVGTSISLIFILGGWLIVQFALTSLGVQSQYQLAPDTCGTTGQQCSSTQFCSKKSNTCVEKCVIDKRDNGPDGKPWSCHVPADCGNNMVTINDCAANPNTCAPGLCLSDPATMVCCYNPSTS